jgi:hypothetical protein
MSTTIQHTCHRVSLSVCPACEQATYSAKQWYKTLAFLTGITFFICIAVDHYILLTPPSCQNDVACQEKFETYRAIVFGIGCGVFVLSLASRPLLLYWAKRQYKKPDAEGLPEYATAPPMSDMPRMPSAVSAGGSVREELPPYKP